MTTFAIFDFDGTLADTAPGILATTHATLDVMGLPQVDDESIKSGIGLPLRKSLIVGAGIPEVRGDEAVVTYRSLFMERTLPVVRRFDGVKECLDAMKAAGVKLALATSRSRYSLVVLVAKLELEGYFDLIVAADDGIPAKPKPDMVLHLLKEAGKSPEETIVVGDTIFDLQMGAGAGCRTCGVTYGNHTRQQLESVSPDFIVDDLRNLEF